MGTRDYLFYGVVVCLLNWTLPNFVQAQAWLSDHDRAGGTGLRVGNLEVHPGLGLEGGYDRNIFLEDEPVLSSGPVVAGDRLLRFNEDPDSAFTLRLSPHLFVSTLSKERLTNKDEVYTPPTISFRGGLSGSLYYLTGVAANGSPVRYDGRIDLDETILPERTFSLALTQEGQVRRLPLQGSPGYQWHGGAGAKASLGTDGGLLRGTLRYKFGLDRYTAGSQTVSLGGNEISDNDGHTHEFGENVNWRFFPQTSLFQDASIKLQSYDSEGGDSPVSDRYNSGNVTLRVGANGALTKQISTTIGIGYGAVFFADSLRDSDGLLGQAMVQWRPSAALSTKIGYSRSISTALLGNTRTNNRFDLGVDATLGQFVLGLASSLRLADFGVDVKQRELASRLSTAVAAAVRGFGLEDIPDSRSDVVLTVDLNGEYKFVDWLALTGQLGYAQNFTDYMFLLEDDQPVENATGDNTPTVGGQLFLSPSAYWNVTAMIGLRAFL